MSLENLEPHFAMCKENVATCFYSMIYGGQKNIYSSLVVNQALANLVKVAYGEVWKSVAR